MINWKTTDEIPADGTIVAVLLYHWKEDWPQSAEIYFGEVESCETEEGIRHARVLNNDYIGGGSSQWYFQHTNCYQKISAWAYADEFKKPEFLGETK